MRTTRTCLRLIGVVLALLSAAPTTRAQGSDGLLPEPISATRLGEYGDVLNLSREQRHAMENLHAGYRDEFQKLCESQIDSWLRDRSMRNLPRSFFTKQRDLAERIGVLDNQFFDRMQEVMTDEQSAIMPRVRAMRLRERLAQPDFHWWSPGPFDLSAAVLRLALPPEQMQAIEPILATYEPALTAKVRNHVDASDRGFMRQFDEYARHGLSEADLNDPAKADAFMAIFKSVADTEAPGMYERSKDILDLNRRTLASLAPLLTPEAGRWLRAQFLRTVYPQLKGAIRSDTPFDEAMQRDGLNAQQRLALREEALTFEADMGERLNGVMARIDAHRAKYQPLGTTYDYAQEAAERQAINQDSRVLHDEVESLRLAARGRANEISGTLEESPAEPDDDAALGFNPLELLAGLRDEAIALVPGPISQREIAEYARRLDLDADKQRLLRSVHARYVQQCDNVHTQQRQAVSHTSERLRSAAGGATMADVRRFEDAQKSAAASLHALDEAFFAEVQATLTLSADDPGLQRVRLAQQRQWCNRGMHGGMRFNFRAPGGAMESLIDLSTLLYGDSMIDVGQPIVDRVLAEYEGIITPLLKKRYDIIRTTQELEQQSRLGYATMQAAGKVTREDYAALILRLGVDRNLNAAIAINKQIAQVNRQTIDQLSALMPANKSNRLRSTYQRLCWPRIERDPSDAGPLLAAALRLHDLTPQQRADVEMIAADYHAAYNELRQKMVASVEQPDSPRYRWILPTDAEDAALSERRTMRQRLAFDRHELNVRAWQRLRGILTVEQTQASSLRVTPADGPDEDWDFGA